MYDEIIFSPDPRKPYRGSIGRENDREHEMISIQLGCNGTFRKNASHSAILEREVCTLRDATPDQVVEKANTWFNRLNP